MTDYFELIFQYDFNACFVMDKNLCVLAINKNHFIFPHDQNFDSYLGKSSLSFLRKILGNSLDSQRIDFPTTFKWQNRICKLTNRPITLKDSAVDITVCQIEDTTELTSLNENLKNIKEISNAANLAKNAFVSNVSHEIRTPLAAILGFTNILFENHQDSEQRMKCITTIRRNGEHLMKLVEEILDLSKIESDHLEIEPLRFNLADVLEYVEAVAGFKARDKGISLEVIVDKSVPRSVVTDPIRLRQILLNILGNAVKFTLSGGVRLEVSCLKKDSFNNCRRLRFTVTDTGIGISPEDQRKLFNPFKQSDESMTRKFGGSGLGLALSRRLARALGGDVLIAESCPNKGTKVVITIKDNKKLKIEPHSGIQFSRADEILKARNEAFKNLNILVVDDSPDNLDIIEYMLKPTMAHLTMAKNGAEGVEKALQQNFDVVLMDIQMPIMDGHEATRRLRSLGFRKPVIALTAHAFKEDRQRAFQAGFDDHLPKPIAKEALMSAIAYYATKPTEHNYKTALN